PQPLERHCQEEPAVNVAALAVCLDRLLEGLDRPLEASCPVQDGPERPPPPSTRNVSRANALAASAGRNGGRGGRTGGEWTVPDRSRAERVPRLQPDTPLAGAAAVRRWRTCSRTDATSAGSPRRYTRRWSKAGRRR